MQIVDKKTMACRCTEVPHASGIPIFDAILRDLTIESIRDPDHPGRLCLCSWNGRKYAITASASHGGCTYTPAPIGSGLAQKVRFPGTSKQFGSAAKLTASITEFFSRYAHLLSDAAVLLVAFALASWFTDSLPVTPVLYLLGPENEAGLILRLLGCVCRRPLLLGDLDMAALATLPIKLDPTLLINQRNLGVRVARVLLNASNRRFCIARGNHEIHAYGAKAFSAVPEFGNGTGVRVSLSPAQDSLATLTDADEREIADDFQAKLLRYRLLNQRRVTEAKIDTRAFVPAMREEVWAWLAPICDCPDLRESVFTSLMQQSRDAEGNRLSDERCLVGEAALFFCHRQDTDHFFIGDLTDTINNLLKGRHEERQLTDKKVGTLLRALGIHGQRVVKGYKVSLTDSVREQIHQVARAYQVESMKDGVVRCRQCTGKNVGTTS